MSHEGRLKVITTPNTVFLDSEVGDFAISSVSGVLLGTAPLGGVVSAHIRLDEHGVTVSEPLTSSSTVAADLVTGSIVPKDPLVGIDILGGGASIRLDDVHVSGDGLRAGSVAAGLISVGPTEFRATPDGGVSVVLDARDPVLSAAASDGGAATFVCENVTVSAISPAAAGARVRVASGADVEGDLSVTGSSVIQGALNVRGDLEVAGGFVVAQTATRVLQVGDGETARVAVNGPELAVDRQVRAPSIRVGTGPTLVSEPWGEVEGVRVVGSSDAAASLEARAFVVAGQARTVDPIAVTHASGTACVVHVDNGLLGRPAPLAAGSLTLSDGSQEATMSIAPGGEIQMTSGVAAPTVQIGATVVAPTSSGVSFSGNVTSPQFTVADGGTIGAEGGLGLRASAPFNAPELTLRHQDLAGVSTVLKTDSGARLRCVAAALRIESDSAAEITPVPGAVRVAPGALDLVYDLGTPEVSWTRISAEPEGVHVHSPALFIGQAGLRYDAADKSMSLEGVRSLRLDQMCSVSATATGVALEAPSVTLSDGNSATRLTPQTGGVLLGDAPDFTLRSQQSLALQAESNVGLVLKHNDVWSKFAFSSGSRGQLLVNGRDLGVSPFDCLSDAAASEQALDGWHVFRDAASRETFRARMHDGSRPALVRASAELFAMSGFVDSQFAGSSETSYNDPAGGLASFRGAWLDVRLPVAVSLKSVRAEKRTVNQTDRLPAVWRVFGRLGSSDAWKEVARAGATTEAAVAAGGNLPVYDNYRVAVSVVTSGSDVSVAQLQLWGLAPAPEVAAQMSFTGSHLVVPCEGEPMSGFRPGTVVVAGPGHDSVNAGGFKARGGRSSITMDSALPRVRVSRVREDPAVFGVVSGTTDNRWVPFPDRRLVVNGLGEGAILVVDTGGPIKAGDLLATSDVPGHAARQGSPFVAAYTVAKATMDCDFRPVLVPAMCIADPAVDGEGLVAWTQKVGPAPTYEPVLEPEYDTFALPGGATAALISCTYKAS